MPGNRRKIGCVFFAAIFWLAFSQLPSHAQVEPPSAEVVVPVEIESTEAADSDSAIEASLVTIFANVEEFSKITVGVRNGVVRLAGETASDEMRADAGEVAAGISGVIYVDNDIAGTADVAEQLSPGLKRLDAFASSLRTKVPLFGVALVVIVLFWWLARGVGRLFERFGPMRSNLLLRSIVGNLIRIGVVFVGLFVALELIGATAAVGAVLGAAGVAGLALSFAFRDIIENYLASVILSLRQPFRIKDRVQINGHIGQVVRMTSSETQLLTDDGNHLRLPNSEVFKGTITNFDRNPKRRFLFDVGVGTSEDLAEVERAGREALEGIEGVLAEPHPGFSIVALADSSVTVRFTAWVDQNEHAFGKVRSFAIRTVKEAFDEAEISMPSPSYDLVMREVAGGGDRKAEKAERSRVGKAADVDLAPETHLDDEIDEEQAWGDRGNLLDEGQAS